MRGRLVAALAVGVLLLTGCTSDPNSVAEQAKAGDRKGYLSGDGTIEQIDAAKRGAPVELAGDTIDGSTWSAGDVRGNVVVVNVWASWCPPCVAEADDLQKVWADYERAKAEVRFIGLDSRESAANGLAFVKSRQITYPSLSDESGLLIVALQGKAVSVPTTLVLDRQGRIAARVSGKTNATTLKGLIDDVLGEPKAAS